MSIEGASKSFPSFQSCLTSIVCARLSLRPTLMSSGSGRSVAEAAERCWRARIVGEVGHLSDSSRKALLPPTDGKCDLCATPPRFAARSYDALATGYGACCILSIRTI